MAQKHTPDPNEITLQVLSKDLKHLYQPFEFGEHLGIEGYLLKKFETDNRNNIDGQKRDLFSHICNNTNSLKITWPKIADSLEFVNMKDLADDIREKHGCQLNGQLQGQATGNKEVGKVADKQVDEKIHAMTSDNYKCQLYCLEPSKEMQIQDDAIPQNTAGGHVPHRKIWDLTQHRTLKIHFMNPEILQKDNWKCRGYPLTPNTILAWAITWNSHAVSYPMLDDMLATFDEAQIIVQFSSFGGSYSSVGNDGKDAKQKNKATMVLNLLSINHQPDQKSLVIHEFGHALGLEHEHQRSVFWKHLGKKDKDEYCFIDQKKMKNEVGNFEYFEKISLRSCTGATESAYDPLSIMHYWFRKCWLKPKYQNEDVISKDGSLSEEEKVVLLGVHKRDFDTGG